MRSHRNSKGAVPRFSNGAGQKYQNGKACCCGSDTPCDCPEECPDCDETTASVTLCTGAKVMVKRWTNSGSISGAISDFFDGSLDIDITFAMTASGPPFTCGRNVTTFFGGVSTSGFDTLAEVGVSLSIGGSDYSVSPVSGKWSLDTAVDPIIASNQPGSVSVAIAFAFTDPTTGDLPGFVVTLTLAKSGSVTFACDGSTDSFALDGSATMTVAAVSEPSTISTGSGSGTAKYDGSLDPDKIALADCAPYLFAAGVITKEVEVYDPEAELVTIELIDFPVRAYLTYCLAARCESSTPAYSGFYQFYDEDTHTWGDSIPCVFELVADGVWTGLGMSAKSCCLEGATAEATTNNFNSRLTFARRTCDLTNGIDVQCYCGSTCKSCATCADGPSELDALATIAGTPYTIPGYRESDDPCTYLLDSDEDFAGSYLYFEAAGTDEFDNVHGDRFRVIVVKDGVQVGDAVLDCTGEGDQQMLGTYTPTTGSGYSLSVTVE